MNFGASVAFKSHVFQMWNLGMRSDVSGGLESVIILDMECQAVWKHKRRHEH